MQRKRHAPSCEHILFLSRLQPLNLYAAWRCINWCNLLTHHSPASYLQIGVSWWLSAGYTMRATPDYIIYNDLIGENKDGDNTQPIKYQMDSECCLLYADWLIGLLDVLFAMKLVALVISTP